MGFTTTYALTCDWCGAELASELSSQDLPDGAVMFALGPADATQHSSGTRRVILGDCCSGRSVADLAAWLYETVLAKGGYLTLGDLLVDGPEDPFADGPEVKTYRVRTT
jgi:hypothetical protein